MPAVATGPRCRSGVRRYRELGRRGRVARGPDHPGRGRRRPIGSGQSSSNRTGTSPRLGETTYTTLQSRRGTGGDPSLNIHDSADTLDTGGAPAKTPQDPVLAMRQTLGIAAIEGLTEVGVTALTALTGSDTKPGNEFWCALLVFELAPLFVGVGGEIVVSRHQNRCVPALSGPTRQPVRERTRSSAAARTRWWSAAVFDQTFPGRDIIAVGSPVPWAPGRLTRWCSRRAA